MIIKKIISGAQTGADRAALDFAIKNNIPHGGWVPKGRKAEDGVVPEKYTVQETTSKDYGKRTELNIKDSDGTLIVSHGKLTGGSALTKKLAEKHNKTCLHVDLNRESEIATSEDVLKWIRYHKISVLNVAGSRASKDPEIYNATIQLLDDVFLGI
jgi:hypothetical protein